MVSVCSTLIFGLGGGASWSSRGGSGLVLEMSSAEATPRLARGLDESRAGMVLLSVSLACLERAALRAEDEGSAWDGEALPIAY